ncbi:hypothetical protein [Pseudomonas sp. 8 R 14]|nr:hypothetical protein [Pseudomonas sp. 8 R 14]
MRHPSSGTLSIFGAGAFMDIKGHWKKLVAVLIAIVVLVGQSFIGYVTENGQLPPWMPEKLSGIAGLLSTDLAIPLWMLITVLVSLAVAGLLLFRLRLRECPTVDVRLAIAQHKLAESQQRYLEQDECYSSLQIELYEKSQRIRALEVSEAHLNESNAALLRQLSELPPAPDDAKLPPYAFDMLESLALFANQDVLATLPSISSVMSISNTEALAAIDVLMARGFSTGLSGVRGEYFQLTPAGRAYYLKHR